MPIARTQEGMCNASGRGRMQCRRNHVHYRPQVSGQGGTICQSRQSEADVRGSHREGIGNAILPTPGSVLPTGEKSVTVQVGVQPKTAKRKAAKGKRGKGGKARGSRL